MVRNCTRGTVLAQRPRVARSWYWRMRGMIGRRFAPFDALIFYHNNSIHTLFMGQALDVVFVGGDGRVRSVRQALVPWRLAADFTASFVVELPVGAIAASGTVAGDELAIEEPWS